jgi:hypothetical protein
MKTPVRKMEDGGWRWNILTFCFLLLPSAFCLHGTAQSYSIDWYKIAGGGGTCAGSIYSLSGTIGQHDAGGAMSGGNYSLTGGFWSFVAAVQTAGLPSLSIARSGHSVIISWPNTVSCTLETNNNLAAAPGWTAYGGAVNTAGGTNSVTITPPAGNLFFRLRN